MGEKKKNNMTVLLGAAFLMATSAVGPGFLTQTATSRAFLQASTVQFLQWLSSAPSFWMSRRS